MPTTLRGRRITITIRETPLNPLLVDGYAFASKTTRVFEHEEGFLGKFQKGSAIVVLIAVLSLVAVVSAFGGSSSSAATSVAVTAGKPAEFRFTLSKKTVAKGVTTFKVTNKG
ncbi:MAG: hypothetical protein ACXWZP_00175, partial [Gaiellaceae bacterium]